MYFFCCCFNFLRCLVFCSWNRITSCCHNFWVWYKFFWNISCSISSFYFIPFPSSPIIVNCVFNDNTFTILYEVPAPFLILTELSLIYAVFLYMNLCYYLDYRFYYQMLLVLLYLLNTLSLPNHNYSLFVYKTILKSRLLVLHFYSF